jgi:hypothetical protein
MQKNAPKTSFWIINYASLIAGSYFMFFMTLLF